MVISIAFNQIVPVSLGKTGKFTLNGVKMTAKDVPFVRYKFESYGPAELEFIKLCMSKFKQSGHLAEVNLGFMDEEAMNELLSMENLLRFLYVDVTDEYIQKKTLQENAVIIAEEYKKGFHQLIIRDRSSILDAVQAKEISKALAEASGVKEQDIGICSSPLSFDGRACLTAVKARDFAAKVCGNFEASLPTANHENMNVCGCVKYTLADKIVPVISEGELKDAKEKKAKEPKEKKEVEPKKKPIPKHFLKF